MVDQKSTWRVFFLFFPHEEVPYFKSSQTQLWFLLMRFSLSFCLSDDWWWRWRRNVSFSISASLSLFSALTLYSHAHLWSIKLFFKMRVSSNELFSTLKNLLSLYLAFFPQNCLSCGVFLENNRCGRRQWVAIDQRQHWCGRRLPEHIINFRDVCCGHVIQRFNPKCHFSSKTSRLWITTSQVTN